MKKEVIKKDQEKVNLETTLILKEREIENI